MGRAGPFFKHLRYLALAFALALAAAAPLALALAQEAGHGGSGGDAAAPDLGHGPADAATDDPEVADRGQAGDHGAAGEEHGAGLPQLDFSTFPSQIVWLIVAFGTLYWLMTRKALPRLTDILEAREERIAGDLDRAAALRAEAETALQRYQQVVADAQNRAAERLKEVQERLAAEAAQKQAQLEAELEGKLADAEGRIRSSRDAALGEVQGVAAEVARSAVLRLAGLEVSERDVDAALAKVLAEAA
jgi:F-type H+-transporting ATPase subunit b